MTVTASLATVRVRVAIEDADDAGVVTLSAPQPRVGEALSAALADEDAGVRDERWQWWRRAPGGTWTDIAGATAAGYVPVTGDVGHVLQARVTYADTHGEQQAESAATEATEADAGELLQVGLAGWGRAAAATAVDVIGRRFTSAADASHPTAAAVTLNRRALNLPAAGDAAARGGLLRGVTEALGVRVSGNQVTFTPPTGAQFLSDSAFSVQRGASGGGAWGLWGAGDLSRFGGEVDGVEQDAGVLAGYVGADYRLAANVLAGLAASYGSLELAATSAATGDATLTGWLVNAYPYGFWMPVPWLGVWGIAGAGIGRAALTVDDAEAVQGDVRAWLGAAGQRVELVSGSGWSLAAKADGFVTGLSAGGGLPALSAQAWRGRLLLEAGAELRLPDAALSGRVDLGGRLDGGDAERGLGAEAGAEVSYTHTGLGLRLSGRGRLLLAHQDRGLREWGASAALRWEPQGAGVGPAVSVAPRWGAPASGVDAMWRSRHAAFGAAPPADPDADAGAAWRPDAVVLRLSYGLAAPAGGLRPFAEVDLDADADYRLGIEGFLEY